MKKNALFETARLYLREMTWADYDALCRILQDSDVMYAYEHAFSDEEVREWLGRQLSRYQNDGFGLWGVILKETGELIGQCGLTLQAWHGKPVPEIGYLFQKKFWHQGYAAEATAACKKYAFEVLQMDEVFSIIRDTNLPSQKVAIRNGMAVRGTLIKDYYGFKMPHLVFSAKRG